MLELRDIRKQYVTNSFTQTALDGVSVAFRDNEFVAILGPSGSGKTTMLNVIGGLDHFDSGDLLIDGISTKGYRDRDWDTYRNNRIGFVFQSYNLIPHQTVLANVELALTLSGVSRAERRERARAALERVGLAQHVDKRPSQLSGGQMQRVAIARALINDPEILLADEPTGALDSATSVQVMDLLKEVAKDRLVVMVTHNPELAEEYATRIVRLADGSITDDTDPFDPETAPHREARPPRRTSMSFLTALGLSFNNLMTKKGRTLLTAFAGSIGIIGIAGILALANGVNEYIANTEEEMLSVYPLTITSTSMDMTAMFGGMSDDSDPDDAGTSPAADAGEGRVATVDTITRMAGNVGTNDLASLKTYLDGNGGGIDDHVNDIEYLYSVTPQIFLAQGDDVTQVNPDATLTQFFGGASSMASLSASMSTDLFREMPSDTSLFEDQYEVCAGRWPESYDEMVLVLSSSGRISDVMAYDLGLRDHDDLEEMVVDLADGKGTEVGETGEAYSYDQLMAPELRLVAASDMYAYEPEYGVWTDKSDDAGYMRDLVADGEPLKIVGVVMPKDADQATSLSTGVYYTPELTRHVIDLAADSKIVRDQLADPETDVFTGRTFAEEADDAADTGFDLSSLISVDSSAMSRAFTFDTSAMSFDLSGLDLSGIDYSGVTMPAMDPGSLDIDASSLPGLTADQIAQAFPDLTADQLAQVLSRIEVHFVDGGEQRLSAAFTQVVEGYPSWVADHPGGTVADYMASPEVVGVISEAAAGAIDTADLEAQLTAALNEVLGTDAPSLEGVGQDVMDRLVGAYADQLAATLAQTISQAVQSYMQVAMTSLMTQMMGQVQSSVERAMTQAMGQFTTGMANAMHVDPSALAEAFQFNMDEKELSELMASLMTTQRASCDSNLRSLGYADLSKPTEIDIYPRDFENKGDVISILDDYNDRQRAEGDEDKVITYTDFVGALMSSVTRIVDMISAMLVAFVSISLVVSSIMIAVITYISVLERKKEIGILRSIGASKHDVSNVFNAETVIEGLVAGVMGILITLLLSIPANAIVHQAFGVEDLVRLPAGAALALVAISVALTFIAGFVPAKKASRSDPVEALRSE